MTGNASRLVKLAAYASVATAALLILVKLGAWRVTGSVSILASLIDSAMDAGRRGCRAQQDRAEQDPCKASPTAPEHPLDRHSPGVDRVATARARDVCI